MEKKKKIVFLTGAGISKESGIPTFREAGEGLWENVNVNMVATHNAIMEAPDLVYEFMNELKAKYQDCKPNDAHKAIAELEKEEGLNVTIITQNVDTLHEQAGSSHVIHLHGDLEHVRAWDNPELLFPYDQDITPTTTIRGHRVRPHIVLFGEDVPMIETAQRIMCEADVAVIVGTSFNVYPAAGLVEYVEYGNPIYYVDPNPADTSDYPDIEVVPEKATTGVGKVIEKIKSGL